MTATEAEGETIMTTKVVEGESSNSIASRWPACSEWIISLLSFGDDAFVRTYTQQVLQV